MEQIVKNVEMHGVQKINQFISMNLNRLNNINRFVIIYFITKFISVVLKSNKFI